MSKMKTSNLAVTIMLAISCLLISPLLMAQNIKAEVPIQEIRIKQHLFYPAELLVPVNTKIKLLIINEDSSSEEFESSELNREKLILGNSQTIIFIGPLSEGRYPFVGEFNPRTAHEDSSSEEFESSELNREKLILGNSQTIIFIGPLSEGRYPFVGEFNPHTAQGVIIAK